MNTKASQITSLTIVYSAVYSDKDQRKHQSSALQAFVRGIHRGPVTRKMSAFDDVIMIWTNGSYTDNNMLILQQQNKAHPNRVHIL